MKPSPETFPYPLVSLDETDSTNRYLADLCADLQENLPPFTVVSAEYQTAGKGQRGNSWEAERGANLLFSLLLYPDFLEARRQFLLSQLVSVAIKEELSRLAEDVSIKWPNDIYLGDKKICGMLIENELCGCRLGRSICGVGLNVNQLQFLSPAPNPVSLRQVTGRTHNRHELLLNIVSRIDRGYRALSTSTHGQAALDLAVAYASSLYRRRGYHPYRDAGGKFRARLLRVEPDGRLVLEDEEGRERQYLFKEVQYVLS